MFCWLGARGGLRSSLDLRYPSYPDRGSGHDIITDLVPFPFYFCSMINCL